MDWDSFFNWSFPTLLGDFAIDLERRECPHHLIPQELAFFVDESKDYSEFKHEFFMAWFGVSMVEQGLHHDYPLIFEKWKVRCGEHPIPMRGGDLGSLQWDNPIWLVEKYVPLNTEKDISEFRVFLDFLITSTGKNIVKYDLDLKVFWNTIINSKQMQDRESSARNVLLSELQQIISKI